jgi:hypothetical protein
MSEDYTVLLPVRGYPSIISDERVSPVVAQT